MTTSTVEETDQQKLRRYAYAMDTCPETGVMLHSKNCVAVETWYHGPDREPTIMVMHNSHWDSIKVKFLRLVAKRQIQNVVYDGRELF